MKELFLNGKFISEIARETGRDWKTVAKIVRSADMLRFTDECRAKALELIPDILDMVHKEMKKAPNKDRVRIGIDFLTKARIFEERQIPIQPVPVMHGVDSEEQDRQGIKQKLMAYAEMIMATHKLFGIDTSEIELVEEKDPLERLPIAHREHTNRPHSPRAHELSTV